ncbi:Lon protease-like protein [Conyzicola lurida]|uniref:Lon protease-like protein n=1 Tax=Conyzicola lurida TaxID=1172621 RepID=A0A841AL32_9MICO|nr:LON peptidase substrate-binding domain-containing protein [Conyzicola lurida]MBB5842421.1 Lon protease-like protein [Conyzicola lurida]
MTELPMFPLGSVLFPHMPLQLRVFEDRYVVMLSQILEREPSEFGVVLIERGQEVGGGEHRFTVGTVAQILQLEAAEGFIAVVAQGDRRVEVEEWLDDQPFPRAVVRELPELQWNDSLQPLRERAEHEVRRALALASEFADMPWAASVEISDDPVEAAWQLAAISPLGPLDQIDLVRCETMEQLLISLIELTDAAAAGLGEAWPEE